MASGFEGERIALVRLTPEQFSAVWRRARLVQWVGVVLAWLLLGLSIYLLFWFDPSGTRSFSELVTTPSLPSDIVIVLALLIAPAVALLFLVLSIPSRDRWFGSRTLRRAILAGESAQIPAATNQPSPPPPEGIFPNRRDLKSLRILDGQDSVNTTMPFLVGLTLIGIMAIVVLTLSYWQVGIPANSVSPGFPPAIQSLIWLFQFTLTLGLMARLLRQYGGSLIIPSGWRALVPAPRPRLLAVDAQGIHWRPRGWRSRDEMFAWGDVRAFCAMRNTRGVSEAISESANTYLLLEDGKSLAWSVAPGWLDQDKLDIVNLFLRVVTVYTQLPLLDASGVVSSREEAVHASSPMLQARFGRRFYWANLLAMFLVVSGVVAAWSMRKQ